MNFPDGFESALDGSETFQTISGRQGQMVIKPHSQEGLETENKGQGKEKKRNLDRKQDREVGSRFSCGRPGFSRMLCTGLPYSSMLQTLLRRGMCKSGRQKKGVWAVGSWSWGSLSLKAKEKGVW